MSQAIETGNLLPLYSLGGIKSLTGHGRTISGNSMVLGINSTIPLLVSNPKRIAAMIQNIGAITVSIYFDTQFICQILPGGTLQIDTNFPWIGSVSGLTGAQSPTVMVSEIGLE